MNNFYKSLLFAGIALNLTDVAQASALSRTTQPFRHHVRNMSAQAWENWCAKVDSAAPISRYQQATTHTIPNLTQEQAFSYFNLARRQIDALTSVPNDTTGWIATPTLIAAFQAGYSKQQVTNLRKIGMYEENGSWTYVCNHKINNESQAE